MTLKPGLLMTKLTFVTLEDLLEMLENKVNFKLVEVLAKEEFDKGHIPGAINLPLDEIENLAKQNLKKMEIIVVYCESYSCHASTKAARKLLEMGYKKTLDFTGGKRWWRHAGLDLEK
jgi:rhodanese-related sulfurtransferase